MTTMAGNTVYVQGNYVDVHDNEVVNLNIDKAMVKVEDSDLPTREAMIQAVEATEKEGLWWSSRSWAVVFRVYQMKGYKGSISEFVREVKAWGLKTDHECNYDAVQKPVASGILSGTPERWKANGAQGQTVKLAEALLRELEK